MYRTMPGGLLAAAALLMPVPALALQTPPESQDVRFQGAPRFGSSDGWSIKPRGRVQYDFGHISRPEGVAVGGLGSVDELRRARIGVEGTAPGGFGFALELDVAPEVVEITDFSLSYRASERISLTLGQHNNFQSLEELTSSRFSSFIERAAFTDAFGFERRLGLSGTLTSGPVTVQLGVFHDNLLDIDEGDSAIGVDARFVYGPRLGATQLHLGGSFHWRDNGDLVANGVTTRYRQRPLIHATDVRFVATPSLPVGEETGFGLEAALIRGPFHAAAEAYWLSADSIAPAASPNLFGAYAEIGWYLTGEQRGYRGAKFDRTRVRRSIEEGGFGALQINLRYDHLDLNSGIVRGGIQHGVQAGITWIPTDYARLLLNFARLSYDDAVIATANGDRDYRVDVVAVRAQIDF